MAALRLPSFPAFWLLIGAALWAQLPSATARKVFAGQQKGLFANIEISNACDEALEQEMRCPVDIHYFTYPDYTQEWTTSKLTALCTTQCREDIDKVADSLKTSCQNEKMELQLGNVTLADYGDFMIHRAEHLCMREGGSSGEFCRLAPSNWDVAVLEASGQATWPENTSKCIPTDTGSELCFGPDEEEEARGVIKNIGYPPDTFSMNTWEGVDFTRNRRNALEAASKAFLGWKKRLYYDEFPLEVQCKRCFWKPIALAYESVWGDQVWDEWAEASWNNIVKNCDLTGEDAVVEPYRNVIADPPPPPPPPGNDEGDEDVVPEPNWDLCASTVTIPDDNNLSLLQWAAENDLPSACLFSFNKGVGNGISGLRGKRLCLPQTCQVAAVDEVMQFVSNFVGQREDLSLTQFLSWNKCLHRGSTLFKNDTVCVGPRNGFYTPSVLPLEPTPVYSTTATPTTSPPPLTIPNCGLYHILTVRDSCPNLSLRYGITVEMLRNMNPTIDSECSNLALGRSYCVAPVDGTEVPAITTTFTPEPTTSTSTSRDSTSEAPTSTKDEEPTNTFPPAPGPTRDGTASNCVKWHIVESEQGCWDIQQEYDLTLAQLREWNSYINAGCGNIWPDYAMCVGVEEN